MNFSNLIAQLKMVITIIAIAHWIACIFFYISAQEDNPSAWIWQAQIQDSPVMEQYIVSLNFALTTMTTVGYGDVSPNTQNEMLYGIVAMLVACGVFAYMVGSIG